MNHLKTPVASLALLLSALATMPAMSASSTASSASDSASSAASSGSDSLKKSSDSSSKTTAAAGDYEVMAVTAVAQRTGTLRLTLQAVADRSAEGEYFLYVPEQTVEQSRVAAGQIVTARARPYGLEFAKSDSAHAFFLVLNDDWARDVPSHAVML